MPDMLTVSNAFSVSQLADTGGLERSCDIIIWLVSTWVHVRAIHLAIDGFPAVVFVSESFWLLFHDV